MDTARLRWSGHVVRMDDSRIPKMLLYGRLANGQSRRGNHSTYINKLKGTLTSCNISRANFEVLARERPKWRAVSKAGVRIAEAGRMKKLTDKRELRKARNVLSCGLP